MGIGYFGMAFVSNSESDQCDSLYGNSFDGFGGFSEGPGIGDFLNVDPTNAFAFSFFAGDFYFFTEANGIVSKVTHLDYDDSDNDGMQELTTVVPMAPIRIVGAGVSTCAPFVPM
jgi:hypothetical protein